LIGIRADEAHRATEILANPDDKGEAATFPLIESKTTKHDVDAWWDANDFKLEIPNHMGNCDLCFLKARWKRVAAARDNPNAAQWWADWEDRFEKKGARDGARFALGKRNSYAAIISEATHPDLFDAVDTSEPDVPCSCAVGGYRSKDEEDESPQEKETHAIRQQPIANV
jgi:hypothetical protein